MYCKNCGKELREGALFCGNCGCRVDENIQNNPSSETNEKRKDISEEVKYVKEGVQNVAGKAIEGITNIASQVSESINTNRMENTNVIPQNKVPKSAPVPNETAAADSKIGETADNVSKDNKSIEMWSWLKKDAKRQMFYLEEDTIISEEEFIDCVSDKMSENHVPATIEKRTIRWDRGPVEQNGYFVKPETLVANPVSYMLQFNHVGKFVFVEEKSFITPPDLPKVPGEPKPLKQATSAGGLLLMGIILVFLGIVLMRSGAIGGSLLAIGIIMLVCGAMLSSKVNQIQRYNEKCKEEEREWNKAWSDWQQTIFLHSFQEDINGQLSRMFDSVFGCIRQVSNEKFNKKATFEEETSSNMNELEQIIARRKEESR